jgi:(1->4)-alpha-D-glucan 1-alpha-D-glucosylmutase
MNKALNEAKINTSWVQPNQQWLDATRDFVAKLLEPSARNKFLPVFLPVAEQIARLGAVNSLTQLFLKLTSPGVPDIYQGNEIWDFSLVDPDNRRPVDYELRRQMLSCLSKSAPEELLQNWPDGRIKMFLTQRTLRFRSRHTELFRTGDYLPIRASGTFAESCISFARKRGEEWIMVIAPRLSARVGFPPVGDRWQDTFVELPAILSGNNAHEIFTNRRLQSNPQLRLADVCSLLPFAAVSNCQL